MCKRCQELELRLQDLAQHARDLTEDLRWMQGNARKDARSVNELVAQAVEGRLQPYVPPRTLLDEQRPDIGRADLQSFRSQELER